MRRETADHQHRCCRCGDVWHCTMKHCAPRCDDECVPCSYDALDEFADAHDPQPELPQLAAKE